MIDHRIIDIKTGKPVSLEDRILDHSLSPNVTFINGYPIISEEIPMAPPIEKSYEVKHDELCKSTSEMIDQAILALSLLMETGLRDPNLLRSIHCRDEDGTIRSIPMKLRRIRRDLDWLEKFFSRGPRK
jgi:hypothetical protein